MLLLRSVGCRSMQGYLFHKPMPAEAIAAFEGAFGAPATRLPDPYLAVVA